MNSVQGLDQLPFRHTKLQIDRGTWSVERSKNSCKLQGTVRYVIWTVYLALKVATRNEYKHLHTRAMKNLCEIVLAACDFRITSLKPSQELFIPEIVPRLQCIGDTSGSLSHSITVAKCSPGPGAAPEASSRRSSIEAYWSVPIIRSNESTEVLVEAQISGMVLFATDSGTSWPDLCQ